MGKESIDPFVTPKKEEVVPHYLRASTGSCHEFCKYGRKEAFSAKTKKEKFAKPNNVKDPSLDMKHIPVVKSYPLSFKTPVVSRSSSSTINASSVDKIFLVKYRPSSAKKPLLPDPPEVIKREIPLPSEDVEVSVPEGSSKNADFQSEKRSSSVKSKPSKVKPLDSSEISGNMDGKRKTFDSKSVKKFIVSKTSAKKVLTSAVPLKINSSKLLSTRTTKSGMVRGGSKTNYNKDVPEKTLHVIKMGTEDCLTESTSSNSTIQSFLSPASSKYLLGTKSSPSSSHEKVNEEATYSGVGTDEYVSSDKSHKANVKGKRFKENHKTLTKSRVIVSDDKHRSPVKLNFRSGKVVDLQTDTSSPRKLKFRKGRTVEAANGKAVSRVKTFKRTGDGDDTADAKIPEKVVLKHQKAQGKRDAQGLFNNVIEATASKLVVTRKSKVKALVGAFETVISLQEKKPASHSMR